MDLEGFDSLLASQGGKCALCRSPQHGHTNWHVDHCHATGRVRGILCRNCNLGLGHFKDNLEVFPRILPYLMKEEE